MRAEATDFMYLRLSKEDEASGESCSIASQRLCIRQYLSAQQEPADGYEEIVDDGFSGTSMERPGLQRLLRLAQAGLVRTVIVRDLSRFARNYLEAGHYLEFVFPACGVRFISVNDHYDSRALGEQTGGLELAVRNLLNQLYSRDISRKIKSTLDLKKRSGEYVYGAAPFGYRKGTKKNTIVPDEPAAAVVRHIFTLAAAGVRIPQIAKQLNEQGVTTPSVYLGRSPTRAFWTYDAVRNLLSNRSYTGDTVPFRSRVAQVGSHRVVPVPEAQQTVIPNTHPALVSREVFARIQTGRGGGNRQRQASGEKPLTSYLVCGCCGNRLAGGKTWRCVSARYAPRLACKDVQIREDTITALLLRAIRTQAELQNEKIVRAAPDKRTAPLPQARRRTQDAVQAEKMALYEQYASGSLSKCAYVQQKQLLGEQPMEQAPKPAPLEAAALTSQPLDRLTPALMRELVQRITVYPGNEVRITWNFKENLPTEEQKTVVPS